MSDWAVKGEEWCYVFGNPSRRPVVTDPPYFMWMHNRHFEQVILDLLQLANPTAQACGTIFALRLSL